MAYPQPNADRYVLQGFEFFRLTTPLVSDGDIYESAQGAQAFAIGPNSDISRVNIAYHDDQLADQGRMAQVQISPQRSFTGLVNAKNRSGLYTPSNRPGRILFWPDELYNPGFKPNFAAPDARVDWIEPILDIIQFFSAPDPTLDPARSDKQYTFQQLPWSDPGNPDLPYYLMIPFYGRRWFNFQLGNRNNNIKPITVTLFGVTFGQQVTQSFGVGGLEYVNQFTLATINPATTMQGSYSASEQGQFDYIGMRMDTTSSLAGLNTLLRITTSDTDLGVAP